MSRRHLVIAERLGVTPAGLDTLCRAIANNGDAYGRGIGLSAAGARPRLRRQGFLDYHDHITDTGRALVARARKLGW